MTAATWDGLSAPERASRLRRARVAAAVPFFMLGCLASTWSQLRSMAALDDADGAGPRPSDFAGDELMMGLAAAVGALFAGGLVDRLGARRVAVSTMFAYPVVVVLMAMGQTSASGVLLGILAGFVAGIANTAMNTHALRVQNLYGRPIIMACYAVLYLGTLAGGYSIAFLTFFPENMWIPSAVAAGLLLVGAFVVRGWFVPDDLEFHSGGPAEGPRRGTAVLIGGLCALTLTSLVVDSTASRWVRVTVEQTAVTEESMAAMTMILAAVGILLPLLVLVIADRVHGALGSRRFCAALGAIALLGVAIVAARPGLAGVWAGQATQVAATTCMVPLFIVAAGYARPARTGRNVGAVLAAAGLSGVVYVATAALVTAAGVWALLLPAALLGLFIVFGPALVRGASDYGRVTPVGPAGN